MNICSLTECQTTAGCQHRGPQGQMCYFPELMPTLAKRPVAFRVKSLLGSWIYYDDEHEAMLAAEQRKTDYQGLYVRDGT